MTKMKQASNKALNSVQCYQNIEDGQNYQMTTDGERDFTLLNKRPYCHKPKTNDQNDTSDSSDDEVSEASLPKSSLLNIYTMDIKQLDQL